ARVKITPERPVFLAGYASRNKPFAEVAADLYAKALALEDGDGRVAVLVTTDLIGLPAALAEPVCRRVSARSGLKREQILLGSSPPPPRAGPRPRPPPRARPAPRRPPRPPPPPPPTPGPGWPRPPGGPWRSARGPASPGAPAWSISS